MSWWTVPVLAIVSLLCGCVKNEFRIEFRLDPSVTDNYRLVYYASDKRTGFMMESVAPVEKGGYDFRGITRNPTLVYVFPSGASMPAMVFYAERGDKIKITGKTNNPALWTAGGNKINEELSRWRSENVQALTGGDPAKVNAAVARYVKDNKDSETAALLLLTTFDRRADEKLFASLWNSLSEEARTDKIVALAGRGDRMGPGKIQQYSKVGKLRLHAIGDSLVELNPARFNATLLYFRRNDDASAAADLDTLESLSKPGNTQRRGKISVISFETDSLAWLARLRASDTIMPEVLNAWMPFGESSETATNLGVARTPFFIVVDKSGRQVYRGDDNARAAAEFRRLTKPSSGPKPKSDK